MIHFAIKGLGGNGAIGDGTKKNVEGKQTHQDGKIEKTRAAGRDKL